MTETVQALYAFFSSFGLDAYGKNNVPDDARMPYITYDVTRPEPLKTALVHAWVFYRGVSYAQVCAKCDEIESALRGGAVVPTPHGSIIFFPADGTPFAQEQPDPDKNVRVMYLSLILHANTE